MLFVSLLFSSLLFLNSCSKDVPIAPPEDKVETLTPALLEMKAKLNDAAIILSKVINKPEIRKELNQLASTKHDYNKVSFSELLKDDKVVRKSVSFSFSYLTKELKSELLFAKGGLDDDLLTYLAENNCYIYVPYPIEWYTQKNIEYTIAAHPIDNEDEGSGYIYNDGEINEVIVNQSYADENPVVLLLPAYDEVIVDDGYSGGSGSSGSSSTSPLAPPTPPYGVGGQKRVSEVKIGEIRLAEHVDGIFGGDAEIRIDRAYGEAAGFEMVTGKATNSIAIFLPRKYISDAKEENEKYDTKNRGWYMVNSVWDSNWRPEKEQQAAALWDYDWFAGDYSVTASVKYKVLGWTTGISATSSFTVEGDFLGKSEWDREWFYATNDNPGLTDHKRGGWIVRTTSSITTLMFTTPHRDIE